MWVTTIVIVHTINRTRYFNVRSFPRQRRFLRKTWKFCRNPFVEVKILINQKLFFSLWVECFSDKWDKCYYVCFLYKLHLLYPKHITFYILMTTSHSPFEELILLFCWLCAVMFSTNINTSFLKITSSLARDGASVSLK